MFERDKKTRLRHVALELGGHGLPRSREEAMAMLAEVEGLLGHSRMALNLAGELPEKEHARAILAHLRELALFVTADDGPPRNKLRLVSPGDPAA
jgi:hypothetical protein